MESSEILLEQAIKILEGHKLLENRWAIGGGTVLGIYLNHRTSRDIDIFIEDLQYLPALSPRLNDDAAEALDYVEDHRFISLTFPAGKIDFIACPQITDFTPKESLFFDRKVRLEHSVEIVSKKIFFRGQRVLPRDVFDLAAVYNSDEKQNLIASLQRMPDKVNTFYQSFIKQLQDRGFAPYSTTRRETILPGGEPLIGKEFLLCKELLGNIDTRYKFIDSGFLDRQ